MTDQNPRVRWGIIGCGQIAYDKVLSGLLTAENAEIVAVADPDAARLDRAASAVPPARAFADYRDLLRDPSVQAVYIATPNAMHPEQTIAAAEAGKHVLVEKPMALTAAEGAGMVAAADRAGVKLMVAYMTLFNPAYEAAKRWVQSGLLGEIVSVRGRHSYVINPAGFSSAAAWRLDDAQGGGPLMDVAVYPIASIRDLTGLTIVDVTATGTTRRLHGLTAFDTVLFTFVLDDGTPGAIEAGFTFSSSLIELEGTRGRLSLTGHITQSTAGRLDVQIYGEGRHLSEQVGHEVIPDGTSHFQNYQREVAHFSQSILDGTPHLASGAVALRDLLVTDAVRASIHSGRRTGVASLP